MTIPFGVIDHVPIPAYVFRMVDDEFILELVNAAARARNPALTSLQGKLMAALYRDLPKVLAVARRAIAEQVTVTLEQALRRYDRSDAVRSTELDVRASTMDRSTCFYATSPCRVATGHRLRKSSELSSRCSR